MLKMDTNLLNDPRSWGILGKVVAACKFHHVERCAEEVDETGLVVGVEVRETASCI